MALSVHTIVVWQKSAVASIASRSASEASLRSASETSETPRCSCKKSPLAHCKGSSLASPKVEGSLSLRVGAIDSVVSFGFDVVHELLVVGNLLRK